MLEPGLVSVWTHPTSRQALIAVKELMAVVMAMLFSFFTMAKLPPSRSKQNLCQFSESPSNPEIHFL
jgi:hypothetical protein